MKGRKRAQYIFLVVILLSPLVIMPLSVPVLSNVVVVMHDDAATSAAVKTITESTSNVKVVQYKSLDYILTIQRVSGQVAWVSHGSEDGILAENNLISWRDFSRQIKLTPCRDIVLACYSNCLEDYVSPESIIGVDGSIDAVLGGLIASYILQPQDAIIHQVEKHVNDLLFGRADIDPLGLSLTEITYWTAIFLLSILAYYSGNVLAVTNPTWIQMTVHFLQQNVITNSPAIVLTLTYLVLGQIDIWAAVWQIIGFVIFDVPAALGQMLFDPLIMTDPLFIATIGLSITMIAISVFWGKFTFDLAALIIGSMFILGGVVIDFYDNNNWVG
ncbi:MAG: hypothetical protein OEV85_11400 [Candidatus Thorarchaeota archaeon]|nr:hypothetical protein [Candidatus Thorarchaeota archaeon]